MEGKFDPVHELKMEFRMESIEVNYDLDGRLVLSYSKKKRKEEKRKKAGRGAGFERAGQQGVRA